MFQTSASARKHLYSIHLLSQAGRLSSHGVLMYSVRFTSLVHSEGKFVTWRRNILVFDLSVQVIKATVYKRIPYFFRQFGFLNFIYLLKPCFIRPNFLYSNQCLNWTSYFPKL